MSQLKKFINKKGQSLPHLYQDQNTLEFWVVMRVRGKIRKKNLKTKEYTRAVAMMPDAMAELGDESSLSKYNRTGPNKLLKDFWVDLVNEKIADETSGATLTRMDTIWRHHLEPYFGNMRPDQIRPDMLPAFVAWHNKTKPGVQKVNVYKYLGNLFHHMERVGALQKSQIPVIRVPKEEKKHHDKKKGRIITDLERAELLKHGSLRMRLINHVLDSLGMRKMEFIAIEKERILSEGGRYFFELTESDTKTGLARIIPVPKHVEGMLEAQMRASGESRYLFPMKSGERHIASQLIDKEWRAVKLDAKIKGRLRMHDWRHTRATLMAKQNINPVVACTLLGMSIRVYQMKYLKLTGRDLIQTVDEMLGAK